MAITIERITAEQARRLLSLEEGQFADLKAIEVEPAKLTKHMSAFANTDGGDVYIGIDESAGTPKVRTWRGFANPESANGHIQAFEKFFPLGADFQYEFLRCDAMPGIVLHAQINKTKSIRKASNGFAFLRRGAQSLPVETDEQQKQLQYCKGISSYETETVNVPLATVTESEVVAQFIGQVVPTSTPDKWLRKTLLIRDNLPTVAGVLLFSDEPQSAIPKYCGIKVYRYKTKEQGTRGALAFDPKTVEGCLYSQIKDAVRLTSEIVESIPKLGEAGLEEVKYPPETLHEIITNAVLHRDYSIADDVHIRIFDNRIEVQSPGQLPAHITVENILDERFARNGQLVRILNKFPDPPNKDVGEGLNTAFHAMQQLGLKDPVIRQDANSVLVIIKHEPLASPEVAIMDYLQTHETINNSKAREITYITADYRIKTIFGRMVAKGMIEQVPGTRTSNTAYRKPLSQTTPIQPTD